MAILSLAEVLLELGMERCTSNAQQAVIINAIKRAQGAIERHLKYTPEQAAHTEYYPMMDFSQGAREFIWDIEGTSAVLERLATTSTNELQVRHIPIRDSTTPQVFVDLDGRSGTSAGAFAAASAKTQGVDFWPNYDGIDSGGDEVCRDGIIRSFGRWPTTPGSVKVIYTAGYTADELKGEDSVIDATPIWDATLDEAVRRAKKAIMGMKSKVGFLAGPLESERLGDYSYKVSSNSSTRLFGGLYDLMPETKEKLNDFVNYGWMLAS